MQYGTIFFQTPELNVNIKTIDTELYALLQNEPFTWLSFSKLRGILLYIFTKQTLDGHIFCVNVLSQSDKVDKYKRGIIRNNFLILTANEATSLNANMLWVQSLFDPHSDGNGNFLEISRMAGEYTKNAIQHIINQNLEKYYEMMSAALWGQKILLLPASFEELHFLSFFPANWLKEKHLLITPLLGEDDDIINYLKLTLIICTTHPSAKFIENLRNADYLIYDFQSGNFPKDFRANSSLNKSELIDQVKFLIQINQMDDPSIFLNVLWSPEKERVYNNVLNKFNLLYSYFQALSEEKSPLFSAEMLVKKIFQDQGIQTDLSRLKLQSERIQSQQHEINAIKAKGQKIEQEIFELKNLQIQKVTIESSIQNSTNELDELKKGQTRLKKIEIFEKGLKVIERNLIQASGDAKKLRENIAQHSLDSDLNREKSPDVLDKTAVLDEYSGIRTIEQYIEEAQSVISSTFHNLEEKKRLILNTPEKQQKQLILLIDENKKRLTELVKNLHNYDELIVNKKENEEQDVKKMSQIMGDFIELRKITERLSDQGCVFFQRSPDANNLSQFFSEIATFTTGVNKVSKTAEILEHLNKNLKDSLLNLGFSNSSELTNRLIHYISIKNFDEIFHLFPSLPKLRFQNFSGK